MLPKLDKNLFQDKVKQVKENSFNFKTLLTGILLAGATAVASPVVPNTIDLDNKSVNVMELKDKAFTLTPSENKQVLATHRSHYSHQSHRSHYSHYSSYSSDDE